MSYLTEPLPCDPWCRPKEKYNNLGGYGSYPALQKNHEHDHLKRYMYHTNGKPCCPFTNSQLEYVQKHHIPSKPLPRVQDCGAYANKNCTRKNIRSNMKDQSDFIVSGLGSSLVETSCHNTSTKLPFDVRQVPTAWQAQGPYINGDSTKFACSSGQTLKDCLSAIDKNYDKQGGWLGPYPTSDGFLESNGKLAYYDSNGNANTIDSTYINGVTSSVSCDSNKCMYNLSGFDPTNPKSSKKISFDLQQSCSAVGDCNRNPFYCPSSKTGNGAGTCKSGTCECDGTGIVDGASCDPPAPPPPPKINYNLTFDYDGSPVCAEAGQNNPFYRASKTYSSEEECMADAKNVTQTCSNSKQVWKNHNDYCSSFFTCWGDINCTPHQFQAQCYKKCMDDRGCGDVRATCCVGGWPPSNGTCG